eukprot:TRINITY_DN20259_c0_g1_i2.p1 TRINITY_DN20259_c0_g1~~TRINITY_DN20259_c0_g1_i2.p1  ORF type:complete len:229 (+),score=75.74 TRINITY_DN20259_c0_g1_i2:154-840(+)
MSSDEEDRSSEHSDEDSEDAFMFHGNGFDSEEEGDDSEEEGAEAAAKAPAERSGFSKISQGVLARKLHAGAPVLAMKQSAVTKITEREAARKEQALISRAKKEVATQNSVKAYDSRTLNFEKTLLKVATRGVVKLFTAVAAQNQDATKSLPHTKTRARGLDELSDGEEQQPEPAAAANVGELVAKRRAAMSEEPEAAEKKQKGAAWMSDSFARKDPEGKAWDQGSDSD